MSGDSSERTGGGESARPPRAEIIQAETPADVAALAASLFDEISMRALTKRKVFHVALAGGTTPLAMYRLLADPRFEIDWHDIHVYMGDERCLPEGDPERNDRAAREALIDRVPIPKENVHFVDPLADDAADAYEAELRRSIVTGEDLPRFDLILLGMGPDGHTASLFPGHAALDETTRLVVKIHGSPKPPPDRITFTLPLIKAARAVMLFVTGAEKREALRRALAGDPGVPTGRIKPAPPGELFVVADRAALGDMIPKPVPKRV